MADVICIVPVAPLRAGSSHKEEMVSQLLFGETAEVLSETKDFFYLRMHLDGYEGWCQKTQLQLLDAPLKTAAKNFTANWENALTYNGQSMRVSLGTPIVDFHTSNFKTEYTGAIWDAAKIIYSATAMESLAKQFLGTSYLWGGRSVYGIDCSGFVQMVFKLFNFSLPRDAYQQAAMGEAIGFLGEARCGDLAFFDNEQGKITHVGILLNSNTIIHASAIVRVDLIDQAGIVNSTTGIRTHQLRTIKRIV
jgi:cell wall-associated NlpC family hydrolase